jgi:hypothetical protein
MDEREKLIRHIESKSEKISANEQSKMNSILIRAKRKKLNVDLLTDQHFQEYGKSVESKRSLFKWFELLLDNMTENSNAT